MGDYLRAHADAVERKWFKNKDYEGLDKVISEGLDDLINHLKQLARKGERRVKFPLVGPILCSHAKETLIPPTHLLQSKRVRSHISAYLQGKDITPLWSCDDSKPDSVLTDFPKSSVHIIQGKPCSVFWCHIEF